MSDGVLELFPSRGLDQSILIAVVLGIYVLLFLTEVFGWVWAGLVVPGYLASIFLIQPAAAIAVSIEAILTFAICRLLSDVASRSGAWSPFFGRERFFLLVLVSVIVRQASEIWLLPGVVAWIDGHVGTDLAATRAVSSIGLVLVPLVANMFWKLTLPRGLFQIGVTVGVVYLILAILILPYTNLSFSNLELTYENVALDFLGSAKAYMILLTGAFLAARYNLRYGWDYNGILVPSLLALTWFSPAAMLATVIEALLLLTITRAVLASPFLKTRNLEGPRKVTVVFTVGFALKYGAGWALGDHLPALKLTELFGFGYVLTSLMAVKMLDTKAIGRVLLPTVQVSLAAFVIGSLIGYGFEQIAPLARPTPRAREGGPITATALRDPVGLAAVAAGRVRLETAPQHAGGRRAGELQAYAELWRAASALADGAGDAAEVARLAERVGLRLAPLGAGGHALIEREEELALQEGREVGAIFPGRRGPVLVVPRPRHEAPTAEAAAVLCERLACRAILIAGIDADDDGRTAADALAHPRSGFQVALGQLGRAPVLALRAPPVATPGRPRLHLASQLSSTIPLASLWPTEVELAWEPPPGRDHRWSYGRDHAVLAVHPDDLWRLLAAAGVAPAVVPARPLAAELAARLGRAEVAPAPPSENELRVLEALAARMLDGRAERLPWLNRVAGSLGLELVILPDGRGPGRPVWLLAGAGGVGWLAFAVAPDGTRPLAIEVLRPRVEGGTWRLAAEAFAFASARALVIDGELAVRAQDQYPDPFAVGNLMTGVQAVHEAIHDALSDLPGAAVLSVRGMAAVRGLPDDLIVGVGIAVLAPADVPPSVADLVGARGPFAAIAPDLRYADGSASLFNLVSAGTPQLAHSRALGGVAAAALWFSEEVRLPFFAADRDDEIERITSVGLTLDERPMVDALAAPLSPARTAAAAVDDGLDPILALAEAYAATADVAVLDELARRAASSRGAVAVRGGFAPDTELPYLVLEGAGGRRLGVLLLRGGGRCGPFEAGPGLAEQLGAAVFARCRSIEVVAP